MESKGIDFGQSETEQNGVRKRKRVDSDGQCSFKEPATKKQKLKTSTAHVTDNDDSFDGLPNEMFHMILDYVSTSDLLNCRQVNRRWNEISSQIIRGRDDIIIQFEFMNGQFVQKIDHHSKTLTDIVNCIRGTHQFPFRNYRFNGLSDLRNKVMRDFLAIFGPEILSLEVHLNDSKKMSETLRQLVYEKAPNLKILGIWYDFYMRDPKYDLRLVESTNQLLLPKLEILRMDEADVQPKIIEAIMMSSVNLKLITLGRGGYNFTDDLQSLHRAGKLHCLKNAVLLAGHGTIDKWLRYGPLQLQSLNLAFATLTDDQQLMSSFTQSVGQLFQAIKNTLQSLETESLGFLTGLVLPRFEKLKKLSLWPASANGMLHSSLPPLFDWNYTFPNLKELDFRNFWLDSTFHQSKKTLPTVETLRIGVGYRRDIEDFMKLTPNVKTLVIKGDSTVWDEWPSESLVDIQAISTHLPKLENFGWELITGTKDIGRIPHMYKFDAAITGLPADLCKKLAEKFRNKDKLTAAEVAKYHSKKSQASIFDLKGLKNFYVELLVIDERMNYFHDDSDSESEFWFDTECSSEMTKVSKFLGFDLMPNLTFSVHAVHCRD